MTSSSPLRRFVFGERSLAMLDLLEPDGSRAADPIPRVARDGRPLPSSFAQQRLWFLDRLSPGNPFYNCEVAVPLPPRASRPQLQKVMDELVARHEALRTTFIEVDGQPYQVVHAPSAVHIDWRDLRSVPVHSLTDHLDDATRALMAEPFDLERGPLLRVAVFQINAVDGFMLLVLHHIVSDGWSMQVLQRELATLLEAASRGEDARLPPLPVQYADFAAWQRQRVAGSVLEEQLAYWRSQLADLHRLELPTDRLQPLQPSHAGAFRPLRLAPLLTNRLRVLARRHDTTLFMVLLAAFKVLLARWSGQRSVAVGIPVANRTRPELEGLIGFFVNTLVLHSEVDSELPFHAVLAEVREVALAGYSNQDVPFERVVQELAPERDPSRNPLFDVIFQLFSAPGSDRRQTDDGSGVIAMQRGTSKFNLRLDLWEDGDEIAGQFEYATDVFDAETVDRMIDHLHRILQVVVDSPDTLVSRIPLLADGERELVTCAWNQTRTSYPWDHSVEELFEEVAAHAPDAVAVCDGDSICSYRRLNRQANGLALHLGARSLAPDERVGVLLHRGQAFVAALLGILKARGAYVPLDPAYPDGRLSWMVADTGARFVVCRRADAVRVEGLGSSPLIWEDITEIEQGADDDALARSPIEDSSERLAYVMYTSGSTGRPKGVAIPHRGITRLVVQSDYLPFGPDLVFAHLSNLSFDAATLEIWGPLLNGASLVCLDQTVALDPERFAAFIRDRRVNTAFLTTALFNQIFDGRADAFASLHHLMVGGSMADPGRMASLARSGVSGPRNLLHVYGPTENTTYSLYYRVPSDHDSRRLPPLGRPIANSTAYVLDANQEPCPIGVPGELWVGGDGVAVGYLGRPELNRECFVEDPWSRRPGARLYRTGDRARWLADGNLEFLGRRDHQVKLRGFRIELEEIEHAARQHPGVRDAVVLLREDREGDPCIVLYVVPGTGAEAAIHATAAVDRWKQVYSDIIYGTMSQEHGTFNITGWNSSYTGAPLSEHEMREQVDATLGRLRALAPGRVLEIGVGTGLLLLPLAPEVEEYVGLDFSESAIGYVEEQVAKRGLSNVVLLLGEAQALEQLPAGHFDLIVLNSVVQYFPDEAWLGAVLDAAMRCLAPGGTIFLGDVRHHGLEPLFRLSTAMFAAGGAETASAIRARIAEASSSEQELLVSPAWLEAWALGRPEALTVRSSPKRGRHDNELTRFRFDAWITHGSAADVPLVWRDWEAVGGLEELARLEAPFAVRNIPDARLSALASASTALLAGEPTVSTLAELSARDCAAVHPEDLWQLGERLGRPIWLRSGAAPGTLDAALLPADVDVSRWCWPANGAATANQPLGGLSRRSLVPQLREVFGRMLPAYMHPSGYVVLDSLPLTANGKVDRTALPRVTTEVGKPMRAPSNDLERQLAGIWAEVLGLPAVGLEQNFFTQLGGHSLLATQVIARIRARMGMVAPLRALFDAPTIERFARILSARAATDELGPIAATRIDVDALPDEEVDRLLASLSDSAKAPA